MKNYKTMFITFSILTLFFQGCGSSRETTTSKVYPTAIGEGVSITTDEKDAVMAPSIHALEEVSNNIAHILKTHIVELNQEEAISFTKEIYYCDISGEKESINSENFQSITNNTHYQTCKSDENNQDGDIELTYEVTDNEGKYPKILKLLVKERYTFNDMVLKKDLVIESKILYNEDKSLNKISLKINGLVDFDYQTITLKCFEQEITF